MAAGDQQDQRWDLRVSRKLDRAVAAAARKAGMSKSAWIKMILTQQSGLVQPVVLYQTAPKNRRKR